MVPIRYISTFSGIEAASVAWEPLCARDHKGVGNEYVGEGKVICHRPREERDGGSV